MCICDNTSQNGISVSIPSYCYHKKHCAKIYAMMENSYSNYKSRQVFMKGVFLKKVILITNNIEYGTAGMMFLDSMASPVVNLCVLLTATRG